MVEMDTFKCTHCSKTFSGKSNLTRHQRKSKYCLEIQAALNVETKNELQPCEYCNIDFNPNTMKRHLLTCKAKTQNSIKMYEDTIQDYKTKLDVAENKIKSYCTLYDEQLRTLSDTHAEELRSLSAKHEEQISRLKRDLYIAQGKIEVMEGDHECVLKMASQAKVTNNTKILALGTLDLSKERLESIIQEKLTYNHGVDGQKGIAAFVDENLLIDEDGKSNYLCTDPSRKVFKYKDEEGKECKDIEARNLTKSLVDAKIVEYTQEKCFPWCMNNDGSLDDAKRMFMLEKMNDVRKLKHDNSTFSRELSVRKA